MIMLKTFNRLWTEGGGGGGSVPMESRRNSFVDSFFPSLFKKLKDHDVNFSFLSSFD